MGLPRVRSPDSTWSFLRDPYGFISSRCDRFGTDAFETRMLLRPTVCMRGRDAAELFYDESRFTRRGALPRRVVRSLFGRGGVQGLDGDAHRHRKSLFMSLTTPARVARLGEIFAEEWERAAPAWEARGEVTLYPAARELLTRAVCAWAGVPLDEQDVGRRARELSSLYEQAATVGPPYWRLLAARRRLESWGAGLVDSVRAGRLEAPRESALAEIARFGDRDGEPLPARVAAVELLSVLRPTVAVSVYVVHCAVALHEHPAEREKLREPGYDHLFAQEVRRLYPFFPAVAARVREDFEWRGYRLPRGRRVMLDLHGTNHDPRTWDEPRAFRPERFADWTEDRFAFIPQGGGDAAVHHRCPGEGIALELMKVSLRFLAERLRYELPEQDLRIDRRRLPALARSGFVMRHVGPRR